MLGGGKGQERGTSCPMPGQAVCLVLGVSLTLQSFVHLSGGGTYVSEGGLPGS